MHKQGEEVKQERNQNIISQLRERLRKLERENRRLKIYLDMYEQDSSALLEKWVLDPDDKIDREDLKRMLNYLIGENRRLKTKLELSMSQNYCTICGNILNGYVPPKEKDENNPN